MFLQAQGIVLQENIVYQDNQSSMKILKNGKRSSSQKTKHMDNRYFGIKDRTKSEGIQVEYCPTENMVADFFTKPLQGGLFKKFRDIILGYKHISTLEESPFQERIGSSVSRGNHFRPGDSPSVATDVQDPSFSNAVRKKVTFADVVKRSAVNNIC